MIPPRAVNGNTSSKPETDAESSDSRFLLYIVGGIITAFLLGIVILIIALMTDWTSN